jgi:hypothetical protein
VEYLAALSQQAPVTLSCALVRFVADSALEGSGFEPLVPPQRSACRSLQATHQPRPEGGRAKSPLNRAGRHIGVARGRCAHW